MDAGSTSPHARKVLVLVLIAVAVAFGLWLWSRSVGPGNGVNRDGERAQRGDHGDNAAPFRPGPEDPGPSLPAGVSLAFESTAVVVKQNYDQRCVIPIRNTGSVTVQIRVFAESPEGLFAGFVGRGTRNWNAFSTIEIQPGETWPLPFIVHANAAVDTTYQVPVTAVVVNGTNEIVASDDVVTVSIERPELRLSTAWIDTESRADQARLVKMLRITNTGADIPELTVEVQTASGEPLQGITTSPVVEQMHLRRGEQITLRIWPRLTAGFRETAGVVIIDGLEQTLKVDYAARLPDGKGVFLARSRCSGCSTNSGTRCTNRSSASYSHPETPGTPSDHPEAWDGDESELTSGAEAADEDSGNTVHDNGGGFDFGGTPLSDTNEVDALEGETTGTEGTLPPESNGSEDSRPTIDIPLGLPPRDEEEGEGDDTDGVDDEGSIPFDQDRTLYSGLQEHAFAGWLRDPLFNTKTTLAYRDSFGFAAVVLRQRRAGSWLTVHQTTADGTKTRTDVVRGDARVYQPALGRTADGALVAAFARVTGDGQSVIVVHRLSDGFEATTGASETASMTPLIVPGGTHDMPDLVFIDGRSIRSASLGADLALAPTDLHAFERPIRQLYRARRAPDGSIALMLSTDDGRVDLLRAGNSAAEWPGTAGDFAWVANDELVVVIRRADGSIVDASPGAGSPRELLPASSRRGPPVLVPSDEGLRLYVHDAATPDGSVREGTRRRVRQADGSWGREAVVQQPEAPVVAAAVVLEFSLPWQKAHYKEMNTRVLLNGREIGVLTRHVPSGRYFFPVPVDSLRYGNQGGNRVDLQIRGMGKGNFHVTDRCEIYTMHRLVQEYLVASSAEEAQEIAMESRPEMRHAHPDLLLACTRWGISRDAQPGDRFEARILLVNVGDAPVPAGELVAETATGAPLGRSSCPSLAPLERRVVSIPIELPTAWDGETPVELVISADVPRDPRPDNNRLRFYALRKLVPELAGTRGPSRVEFANISGIREVDAPPSPAAPHSDEGATISRWYRLRAPSEGELVLESVGMPPELLLGYELYGENGLPLTRADGTWRFDSDFIYLRLQLDTSIEVPESAILRIWWE